MKNAKILLPIALFAIILPLTISSLSEQQDNRSNASANLTTNAGRPFADNSAWNQPIGSNVQIDPNSAAIVANLASGKQGASLYDFGTPIFFANASTPKYPINCIMDWGTCGLEAEPVPIPDDARQAPGSDAQMVIIDLSGRKSYEFWVYKNDKASANWGAILPLDGDGRGTPDNSAIGAGTSRLAGIIRTYEIEQGVIDHALVFSTKFCQGPTNSSNFRYPATKTDGKYTGAGAIPEGARVQLDPSIDVNSIPGISKGEKAVAVALQKYGAYAIDCGGAEMAIQFENPIGKNDPYPAAGLTNDYFEFDKIPWDKMRVLKEWNSYTAIGGAQPTSGAQPTVPLSPAPSGVTPTIYCVGGVGAPPCAPISPGVSVAPTGGTGSITPGTTTPPVGGTNPTTNPVPTVSPCPTESSASVMHNKKKKKYKHRKGNRGGFLEQFLRFIFKFIEWFFQRLGIPMPNYPDPGEPTPEPCPEPTTPEAPTSAPQPTGDTEPSAVPSVNVSPTIGATPTIFGQPTTNPTIGGPVTGQILWQDAPASPVGTTHPLQNWDDAPWNIYGGATVSVVADPVKGKAIRFFGAANQFKAESYGDKQRGEIVPSFKFQGGENVWLGFDLWVDEPLGLAKAHQHLWQIKSDPSDGSPTFVVNINNHRDGLVVDNNGTLFAPTPYNKWVRFVYGINATKGGTSSVEIWMDGKQVMPRTNQEAIVRSGDKHGYMKFGIYRSAPRPYDMSMRMANFKIGTTKEIVQ